MRKPGLLTVLASKARSQPPDGPTSTGAVTHSSPTAATSLRFRIDVHGKELQQRTAAILRQKHTDSAYHRVTPGHDDPTSHTPITRISRALLLHAPNRNVGGHKLAPDLYRNGIPSWGERTRINSTVSKSDGSLVSVSVGRVRMKAMARIPDVVVIDRGM